MSPRTLPAAVLMPEYEALLRDGAELPLVISGESMLPFLRPGRDTVYLKQPDAPLRRGEIAFYRRLDGSYILHRVCRAEPGAVLVSGRCADPCGGPASCAVRFEHVTAVRRGERLIQPRNLLWRTCRGPGWNVRLRPLVF